MKSMAAADASEQILRSQLAQERAFLITESARPTEELGGHPHVGFRVVLRNVGASPARIASINYGYGAVDEVDMVNWVGGGDWGSEEKKLVPSQMPTDSPFLALDKYIDFEKPFYLMGTIEYQSLPDTEQRFETHFCFEVRTRGPDGDILPREKWVIKPYRAVDMPLDT